MIEITKSLHNDVNSFINGQILRWFKCLVSFCPCLNVYHENHVLKNGTLIVIAGCKSRKHQITGKQHPSRFKALPETLLWSLWISLPITGFESNMFTYVTWSCFAYRYANVRSVVNDSRLLYYVSIFFFLLNAVTGAQEIQTTQPKFTRC